MTTPAPDDKPPEPPPNPKPVTPPVRQGPIVVALQPLPTPPNPPPGLPDGCGCAFLSVFFCVLLAGVFLGFCSMVFPRGYLGPQVPEGFFWGGLILVAVGSFFLGRRAERGFYELEAAKGSGKATAIGCGLLLALPVAVYLFLLAVCN